MLSVRARIHANRGTTPRRGRRYRIGGGGIFLALTLSFMLSAPTAGAVTGTDVLYTLDADFDQGTLVNVNHDAPNNNQLQLNAESGTFPFIWIALSQRCTIAKINTETGAILGEFRTISDEAQCNESSRTTVGIDGTAWVGHRGPGGVTHVGLAELNQCLDRNGNGTIETSSGYGDVKAWPGADSNVSNAVDECILHHVDTDAVFASGFDDSRHMSIDADNKLWVGSYFGGSKFVRINGTTGTVETVPKDLPCGAYGGLIDSNGVIWSAPGSVLRWDPDAPDSADNPECISTPVSVYGVAIDSSGWVWVNEFGDQVAKVSPDGNTFQGPFFNGSATGSQGLAIDADGDAWISSSLSCYSDCTVGHLKNDGTFVGNVATPTGSGSTGVAVDAAGKVWTANRNSNTATRIDPDLGPLGCGGTGCGDGTRVGEVDLTVTFTATPDGRPLPYPYNYSDMTGAQLFNNTAPQGTWTVTQDGIAPGTDWGTITWNTEPQGNVPAGATLTVEARAADTEAGLGSETYVEVTNGTAFTLTGRFIQTRVTFKPNSAGASPVLSDIRIQADQAPPTSADVSVEKSDSPDPVMVGQELTYTITVSNAGPNAAADVTLTDALPAGVTFVSATPSQGTCSGTATVICNLGTIGATGSATVTIKVIPTTDADLSNTATATSTTADPNTVNNSSTEGTVVNAAPVATTLDLEPPTATNTAGEEHCVTATVEDQSGAPVPGVVVNFTVSGANTNGGADTTDASGEAEFCYIGTVAGDDTITATAVGGSNPSDTATKTWEPGDPASLVLTPDTATNIVDEEHCVTATVEDEFGNLTPGITVRFSVTPTTFRTPSSGSAVTDGSGQAEFCYTSALPGNDVISAYADTNGNGVQDAGEPGDTATKKWVLPASTAGCKVTYGGRITAANGDKATFGGSAQARYLKGQQDYQDHGPAVKIDVHSINVLAVTCSSDGTMASIFGKAKVNGAGSYDYRIDVTNPSGSGPDTYRIRLSNGYDSGQRPLSGGNVQIQ